MSVCLSSVYLHVCVGERLRAEPTRVQSCTLMHTARANWRPLKKQIMMAPMCPVPPVGSKHSRTHTHTAQKVNGLDVWCPTRPGCMARHSLSRSRSRSRSLSRSLSLSLTAHTDQELQSAGRIFVEASVPAQRPAPQHTAGANEFLAGNRDAVRREGARSEPPAIRRESEREEESSNAAAAGMCAGTQRASEQSRACPRSIAWPARSFSPCPWLADRVQTALY